MSILSQIAGYFLIPKEVRKKIDYYQRDSQQSYQKALNYESKIDIEAMKEHYLFKEYKLAFEQIFSKPHSIKSIKKKVVEVVEKNYKLMRKIERAKDYMEMAKRRLDSAITTIEQGKKLLGDFEIDLNSGPLLDLYRTKYKQLKLVERLWELDKYLYELERKKMLTYLKFLDQIESSQLETVNAGNLTRLYQRSTKDLDGEEKYLLAKRRWLENKGQQLLKQLQLQESKS